MTAIGPTVDRNMFPKRFSRRRVLTGTTGALGAAAILAACGTAGTDSAGSASGAPGVSSIDPADFPDGPLAVIDPATIPRGEPSDFGPGPAVPEGPLSEEAAQAVELLYGQRIGANLSEEQLAALAVIGASADPRLGWLIADHIRVFTSLASNGGISRDRLVEINNGLEQAASQLTGRDFPQFLAWNPLTSSLIAWDIPAPPDYLAMKRNIYTPIEPAWEALMTDNSVLDWRIVSWGGVLIDSQPFGETQGFCNCIPAVDNPTVESASDATWLAPDDIVFGVVINGEARAYPRRIMEVREMVNDTLGGRDFGMPYCTLCGSAQVWFTDNLPDGIERPVLRTSGLLSRSNKVMYDLTSLSIFDTFLGTADAGPLLEEGIVLDGHTVVTSTWAAWTAQHPNTTVLTEDQALGQDFDFRNGRDADGPIFPIGDVDPRLAVQEDILGVVQANGRALATHVNSARAALQRGEIVVIGDIRVVGSGDGLLAFDSDGNEITAHQAFWFAWSQFHPATELWPDV